VKLRCAVCGDVQPVSVADEADEDLRTQGIRRTFRAEHAERCGEGTVRLVLPTTEPEAPTLTDEQTAWMRSAPADVHLGADGFFSTSITRDGTSLHVRVCEDCWRPIPRYVEFPFGLSSPESDTKVRVTNVDGKGGIEHLLKAVCLPCYRLAFARVYPGAALAEFCADVVGDGEPIAPPAPAPDIFVSEPGREVAV
jgi:hypothetical protein